MSFKRAVFGAKKVLLLRDSNRMFLELLRDERLEPEQLAALQAERAIRHARFAMANTRFYRELYTSAGFTLEDLDDPAAFSELPMVDKSHVREHFADFRSTEATDRNSRISTTGGSTGEPLKVLRDLRTPTRAIEWRLFSWWGVDPSDDIAIVYRQMRTARAKFVHDLEWWPSRRIQLDAFDIDEAGKATFFRQWKRVRPALLTGYAGAIAELAAQLEASGTKLPAPRAVGVTAAPVTRAQASAIETAFGAPVFDHYRSAEVPWVAGECAAHEGLHTFADVRVVEILDHTGSQAPPGVTGEVVATDLTNRVFPLIRYRLGDHSSYLAGPCPCGRTLPRISGVIGRVSDTLRLPDGQIIPGESVSGIFKNSTAVRQFQAHQQADYSIVLRCVLKHGTSPDKGVEEAHARIRANVRDKVPVRLEIVDSIPHQGGKIRYIVSDVLARESETS